MDDDVKNNFKAAKNAVRHHYLQLMNLPRKFIQDVLDLFSMVEEDADSAIKQDDKLIILSPLLQKYQQASIYDEASDLHYSKASSCWMKKYEAVMDNILVSFLLTSFKNAAILSHFLDRLS